MVTPDNAEPLGTLDIRTVYAAVSSLIAPSKEVCRRSHGDLRKTGKGAKAWDRNG